MNAIIKTIPEHIKKDIDGKSILDFGSGIAAGTIELISVFPNSKLISVDFSETAVKINKRDYPQIESYQEIQNADVVISSNVIEHTNSSKEFLEKLASNSNNYIIIFAPYNEDVGNGCGEHVISISEKDFPKEIGNFEKIFEKCDVSTPYWISYQILVIYKLKA